MFLSLPLCIYTCVFSYLEQGAVALQPGGAKRGDGAQAAPEVDARQQRTVSQQQTRRSLWGEKESEGRRHCVNKRNQWGQQEKRKKTHWLQSVAVRGFGNAKHAEMVNGRVLAFGKTNWRSRKEVCGFSPRIQGWRGEERGRWMVGVVVDWGWGGCGWGGAGKVLKHLERQLERKHMKSISPSLSWSSLSPSPHFPLCHLREVSQCYGGTQPCSHY